MIVKKLSNELIHQTKKEGKSPALVYLNDCEAVKYLENNIKMIKKYPFINAYGIEGDYEDISKLSYLPYVDYIGSVSKVSTLPTVIDKNYQKLVDENNSLIGCDMYDNNINILYKDINKLDNQNYENINNNFFNKSKYTGKNVRVCIMDTGVNNHIDLCSLNNRIVEFKDFEKNKKFSYDDNGHGTFVAGVCCGNGIASGKKIVGVAPEAEIVSVKIMNKNGETGAFQVLDGMQWVMDNYKRLRIRVVCMSFGASPQPKNDPLEMGARVLVDNGITVVCASGNSGENNVMSPASEPNVIAVGAVDNNYKVASFSSRGFVNGMYKPDVYACGVNINGLSYKKTYIAMSGTSVSAPVVAGYVCLLAERFPFLAPRELKEQVKKSCKRINGNLILDI